MRCLRHRSRLDRAWCRTRGSPGWKASARYRGLRCRTTDRPPRNPAAARRAGIPQTRAVLLHARQDVIAGAVEDAVDAGEGIAVEPFAQRLDDRNAAATEASKLSATPCRSANAASFCPCLASSALLAVTTDLPEASAASTAALAGSPAPPINSTKTSMTGSRASSTGSATQRNFFRSMPRFLLARTGGDRDHLHRPAAARNDLVAAAFQQLHHGPRRRSESGKTDFQRFGHETSPE